MSAGWIWTIWALVMIAWSLVALMFDLGTYEPAIFMAGAILVSVAANAFGNQMAEEPM